MIGKEKQGVNSMKKAFAWLLCLIWMGVIYLMSAMPGDISGEQSGLIVNLALGMIRFLFGQEAAASVSVDLISFLVRKAAHMAEYAVLFLLYRRALALSGVRHPYITALAMSACYAATDEWHQGFVADRGPSAVDVGIDTLGSSIAWGAHALWRRITKHA